jgi:hypothetical protein
VSNNSFDDWDPIWVKPQPHPEEDQATVVQTQTQILLGWTVDHCLVRIEALDQNAGETPITRVQVIAASGVVFDSGAMTSRDYRETVSLELPIGTHQVELRIWNSGDHRQQPLTRQDTLFCYSETPTPPPPVTPTPLVIEPTPQPENIFVAATEVAMASGSARQPATLPLGAVVATPTPEPLVITNTPTPENAATRAYEQAYATAMVATTGTPTPLPAWWVTATSTPTATETPLPTETPVAVPWTPRGVEVLTIEPTPTQPIPPMLQGKILFRSDRDGGTDIFVVNPDGTDIQKLTASWPYEQALAKDSYSADGIYKVFVKESSQVYQIFFYDAQYQVEHQVSLMGSGASWDAAIEPGGWQIAFVSNETGNDELYVVNRDSTGLVRITDNEWEWDRHPSWSPAGDEIVFWSNRTGRKQLYIVSPDGSNLRRLSDGLANDSDPVWVK